MDLEWFFEGVFVDLGRFDFREVVFDVDEILVGDDGDEELLVVLQEGVHHEGVGHRLGSPILHRTNL